MSHAEMIERMSQDEFRYWVALYRIEHAEQEEASKPKGRKPPGRRGR